MKLHAFLSIVLFFLAISVVAQDHYQPVGNFTDAMNINILEAKVNGLDLQSGDEIGIFSGDLCVGHAVLDKGLEGVFDSHTKSAVAGSDDAETTETDGFTSGGTIVFRFWDASEQLEIPVSEVAYYNPKDGNVIGPKTFAIGATAYVSLNTTYNYKPKADAGADQVLHEGESGQLDGTASFDLNNDSLAYNWSDLDSLGLNETDVASPTFISPKVASDVDYRLVLVVSDGNLDSEPDTVIVKVLNVVSGPVTNAGSESIEVNEMTTVNLDGSKSFDPDGEAIIWLWELSEPEIQLSNSNAANAFFTAPEVNADTTIYAYLTITNTSGYSSRDTVQINILNLNAAPVAVVAYKDVQIQEGDQVVLEGNQSYDSDSGPSELSYQWTSLNGGELSDANKMNAVFTAPWLLSDSTFILTLTVFDGEDYSSPDTVLITVLHENLPPVAFAGMDLFVLEGTEVLLDGTSSFDPEGEMPLFEWFSDYLVFDDPNSSHPLFLAPEQEKDTTVEIVLKVTDTGLLSEYDTVSITILNVNKTPEWVSLPSDTAYLGRSYQGFIEVADADPYDTITFTFQDLPSWLSFIDHGDGTGELFADTIPYVDAFQGNWEFHVQASDGMATIDTTVTLFVTFYTGIHQPDLAGFKVYPNPASDWVTLHLESPVTSETILRIYNVSGNLVREQKLIQQRTQINLSECSRGTYLFEVVSEHWAGKLVKILLN
ncbi:T9SS type A sorting domain-containing protein [Maribellus sediminis]|uniref:T9SS type A sorting domain-containing protein n=1 Tax=Maribellus sediminis TaxID=2696285 RepID=UPI001430CB48|nr:T9SS type A sorting domain-containing protein [Maribellus sediminis]